MGHPFPIREIARQAGLSEATVDRVLNGRGGVRESTAQEVYRAIADLERQRTQVRLMGRTFMIDIVMQAPERFSSAVRAALEAELPSLHPAVVRSRFHFRETGPVREQVAVLDRIARRGSQGVILKAPDVPEITAAVGRLAEAGIPVVTLVTDLPASARLAYVGIDNRAAGATAAYLMSQWLGDRPGHVLTSLSSGFFRNEEEREMGFRSVMRAARPRRTLVEITEGQGLDATQYDLVREALERDPEICAVYSIGGGNNATVQAFKDLGRECAVFIAHDLDEDNTRLLREHRLSAVLHHDLRQDMREACHLVMRAHGALPPAGPTLPSAIQVVTPYNMPAGATG
ncbi:LacI family transcriptional regulator [Streptomyces sp. F-3]|uniref:LacI family DNA-binding transcriptional regulator n=1 Tax=Streptomyces TaxID=1883 RepID=UPI0007C23E64|nr:MULTISPECIES: LacI family DNA-binding transcriptional regulator [Streptomyces]MDN5382578.1 LacI family DNA-binding transcriptional regulator [Streptomyces sp. LB8]GAT81888.1 LacI family transcriptional regulator [Streptomyces sp. F-3]